MEILSRAIAVLKGVPALMMEAATSKRIFTGWTWDSFWGRGEFGDSHSLPWCGWPSLGEH